MRRQIACLVDIERSRKAANHDFERCALKFPTASFREIPVTTAAHDNGFAKVDVSSAEGSVNEPLL
jgi:hypothetical protein